MFPEGHVYGMLSIVVAKVMDNGKFEYIGGQGYVRRDVWFKENFTKGKYIAFVWTNWAN